MEFQNTSFRAESYGILSALVSIQKLLSRYEEEEELINQRTIEIICDNKSLINRLSRHRKQLMKLTEYYKADTDIILQILHQIHQLEARNNLVLLTNIKGHQDKVKAAYHLNFFDKLNIEADCEATKGLKYKPPQYTATPANGAHLYINQVIITSKASKQMREAFLSQDIRSQMVKKFKGQTLYQI